MRHVLVCVLALGLPGCAVVSAMFGGGSAGQQGGVFGPQVDPQQQADQATLDQIQSLREAADADPTAAAPVVAWANAIHYAIEGGAFERRQLEVAPRAADAMTALASVEGSEAEMAQVRTMQAAFHRVAGDADAELASLQEAHGLDAWLSGWPRLLAVYAERGDEAAIKSTCEGMRKGLDYGEQLGELFAQCVMARGTNDVSVGLDWADKGDRAWFESELARVRAEEEARLAEQRRQEAERQAALDRQRAADAEARANAAASAASAPSPAGPISVDIKNNCPHTVKVFFGKDTYSSGRQSTIGSNTRTRESFSGDKALWLLDDNGKPVSSAQPGPNTRELEITSSCTGIVAH